MDPVLTNKKKSLENVWKLQVLVICGVVLFHALGINSIYRACLYLNLAFVLYLIYKEKNTFDFSSLKLFKPVVLLLIGLFLINIIAINKFVWDKELNRSFYIGFVCVAIWLQALYHRAFIDQHIKKIVMVVIVCYLVIQLFAIYVLKAPYGTLKNPHYLAQYSMLIIPVLFWIYQDATAQFKILMLGLFVCAGLLLLHTNSRPAWLSLMLTVLIMSLHHRHKLKAFAGVVLAILLLWVADFNSFSDQLTKLFKQITTEERVYIWQDIWQSQQLSTFKQWLLGHGLDAYRATYSHFGDLELGRATTFNSPHNFLLEILYTAGVLGLLGVLTFYFMLYRGIFRELSANEQYKNIILLLITLLTMNLFFVGITVPFFSSYHLLITALVSGVLIYIKQKDRAVK